MVKKIHLLLFWILFGSSSVFGADSLSYSGRLVNSDGSPVVGPVKLKFDLAYTDDLSNILCTHQLPSADLINGVFHAKLSFTCPDTTLVKVLENVPLNNSIAIRVTNESPAIPKVYSFQALNSVPYSIMANFAKQLSLVGTATGQVLTWNGSAWTAADPVGTVGGVTTIAAEQGLNAVKVDDTVTIGILDGGVTAQKLHPMGATTAGQVLKWNGSNWGPGADTDTGITSETDPNVRTFARTDITGLVPESCSPHQALHYILMNDSLECVDIRAASVADTINDAETDKAPSQNAVFDALALKQNTINASSDVVMKSIKLMTDGTTWMGIKAPATAGNLFFTLPSSYGNAGQILKTDGAGNLSWIDGNAGTITGITTTAPLTGSGTSGSVNLTVNYDNATIGLSGSNDLIVKDSGISNNHISALANIDWSKINKTGAVASDVGAAPTSRLISSGTGLLGGGNLSADRTLSVDVGTTAGKIVQVDGTGKLPAIDGSQLTNLGTNWGKWSDATGGIHYSSGNVGLGLNNPTEKLTMKDGAILFKNTGGVSQYKAPVSDEFRIFLHDDQATGNPYGTNNNNAIIFENQDGNNTPVDDGMYFVNTGADGIPQHALTIKGSGNVGVGQSEPVSKLDVSGEVKVGSTGTGCSAANEGSIRYNSTSKNLEFCDGTSWKGAGEKSAIPSGAVSAYARNTCPTGWLKANGLAVSRTTYASLFSAIGTTFGAGDGSTTFNLPELRGEFIRGWDNGRGKDSSRVFGSWQKGSIAVGDDGNGVNSMDFAGSHFANSHDPALASDFSGAQASSAVADNPGIYTVASASSYFGVTRPRNVALLYCIKE